MSRSSIAVTLLLLAGSAGAQERRVTPHLFVDGVAGLAVPIADSDYLNTNWPSPKVGLRLGVELWLGPRFALAPEVAIEGGPLVGKSAVSTGEVRLQAGLRALFGFGQGHAFFLRALVGADLFLFGPGGLGGAGKANAGLAVEPGLGMQLKIARRAVAGFTVGFPVGVHTYATPTTALNANLEAVAFVGYRR